MIDSSTDMPLLVGLLRCKQCGTFLLELNSHYVCTTCSGQVYCDAVDEVMVFAVRQSYAAIPRARLRTSATRLGVSHTRFASILERLLEMDLASARRSAEATRYLIQGAIYGAIHVEWLCTGTFVLFMPNRFGRTWAAVDASVERCERLRLEANKWLREAPGEWKARAL